MTVLVAAVWSCGTNATPREGQTPTAKGDTLTTTVRAVVESRSLVGRIVRVSGRCLDVTQSLPIGPPPLSRHDWQLLDDSVAVYVAGAIPLGCGTSPDTISIVARVEEDTLPALGDRPPTTRRYLVR